MRWLRKIENDLSKVADAVDYYEKEYEEARDVFNVNHQRVDKVAASLAGTMEYRYAQYQEVEMILKYLEELANREVVKRTKGYMEHYAREMNENTARRYAEAHDDVFALKKLCFEVAGVRNNFLALFKGLETLHFQITNVTKLRVAGMDDATF